MYQSNINPDYLTWNIDDPNSMQVVIRYKGNEVFHFSMYEAIESCNRNKVLEHVAECDRTPWLTRWQGDKQEVAVNILKGIK